MAKKRKFTQRPRNSGVRSATPAPSDGEAESEAEAEPTGDVPFRGDHDAALARADALSVDLEQSEADLEQSEAEVEKLRRENEQLRTRKPASPAPVARAPVKREKQDKRKPDRRRERPAPASRSSAPMPAPADEPRFWFGFEVSWAKLAVGRVVLFALLAIDALLALRHAPRYGAGGFNVAHLFGLDGLGPTRTLYAVAQLVLAYLFTFAACGIATRVIVPCTAAIYGWLYFGSQLDSYQHHYLVALLLLIACFIPWQRPTDAGPATPVRTWALRLLLIQLAILYGWAAISKMNSAWLDGRALSMQIVPAPQRLLDLRAMIDATIGMKAVAKLVLVTELGLAATIWLPRTWPVVAPVGILFHFGIVLTGFDIGLFAWLMIGVYAFVIPDRIWLGLAESLPVRALRTVAGRSLRGAGGWIVVVLGIFGGGALGVSALVDVGPHFDRAGEIALVLLFVTMIIAVVHGRNSTTPRAMAWVAIAHALAMVTWLAVDRSTTVTEDYYRFWGGSARRLGDVTNAERAYRKLIEIAPDEPSGHYQLGRLLLGKTETAAGLAELHIAQKLEPSRARAYTAEAQWLSGQGKTAEAIEKAKEATYAEPASNDARALLGRLTGVKPAAGAGSAASDDDAP